MFASQATLSFYSDLNTYMFSVLGPINTCVDIVTCLKHVKQVSKSEVMDKLWHPPPAKRKRCFFNIWCCRGLKQVRANLNTGNRKAKHSYKLCFEKHFQINFDPRPMWKSIQTITVHKPTAPILPASSASSLMSSISSTHTLTKPAGGILQMVHNRCDAGKSAGPEGVPRHVLSACPGQLAQVFTDIFHPSLAQATVPTCLKTTTIILVPKDSAAVCLNDFCPVHSPPL